MEAVSTRELNRWTLARQHLIERVSMPAAEAVEVLAGMQAQHSPSPYLGLWSRLRAFDRSHLEDALRADAIVKATVMRGTLHLVPARLLPHYRTATGNGYHETILKRVGELDADIDAIRARVVAELTRQLR
jgi:hypothetical protein